jgi:hypothetical protein
MNLRCFVRAFVVCGMAHLALQAGCGSGGSNGFTGEVGTYEPEAGLADADTSGGDGSTGMGNGDGNGNGSGVFHSPPATLNCPAGQPLSCYINTHCTGGAQTTLTGKVYDPAGKVPIFNVIVYVPNDPSSLPVITPGTSTCNTCDTPVDNYAVVAQTDNSGSFTLKGVPTIDDLPLVVQIGKWRRLITVPKIADCGTTALPDTGTGQARLPRNQREGDMPQMALLTGGEDNLGCFLTKVGVDPAEYGPPHGTGGTGRLDIYQGLALAGSGPGLSSGVAGDCTNTSCPLWASTQSLAEYDIVLLACEGDTFDQDDTADAGIFGALGGNRANVNAAAKQAMHGWLDEGGKVFTTHFHYTWFKNGPADFQSVANWLGPSIGDGTCANCTINNVTSFYKGEEFGSWLQNVGALNSNGTITLDNVADSVSTVNGQTERWIYGSSGSGTGANDTKYLSFETPIGGLPAEAGTETTNYCGKAVFTDLHAGGMPSGDVPGSCQVSDLTPQEKALEFLFFDLAACVGTDTIQMPPPQPTK